MRILTGQTVEGFLRAYFDAHERRRLYMTDVHWSMQGTELCMFKGLGPTIKRASFDIGVGLDQYDCAPVFESLVQWMKETALSWTSARERWLAAEEKRPKGYRLFGRRAKR